MQIGKYTLNQNVRVYPELTELSPEESAILPKAYDDERIYKGPEVAISGQNWAVFLSALSDGSIFKIAAQFMSEDDETADQVFSATFAQNVRQFGQPHQVTPSGGQRWNLPFGNLILGRAGVPRMRAINLIATSDSRPVSQLEQPKIRAKRLHIAMRVPLFLWAGFWAKPLHRLCRRNG
jgi:hypothetical protein